MYTFSMLESDAPYLIGAGTLLFSVLLLVRKSSTAYMSRVLFCLIGIPVCLFVSHLFYGILELLSETVGALLDGTFSGTVFTERNWLGMIIPWSDGHSIVGVYLGLVLTAFIVSRTRGEKLLSLLDSAVVPAAVFTAVCCFAMPLYSSGYGKAFIEGDLGENSLTPITSFLGFFREPAADREEYSLAVWAIEGVTALFFAVWAAADRSEKPAGDKALLYIIQYASVNILYPVMIASPSLQLWMANTDQIVSAIILIAVFAGAVIHMKERKKAVPGAVIFALAAILGAAFTAETQNKLGKLFKLLDGDRGTLESFFSMPVCYLIILVCGITIGIVCRRAVRRSILYTE